MRAKGKFEFIYGSDRAAAAVSALLQVDNVAGPRKLKVKTISDGNKVVTCIEHEKLSTFFATIDDLLFCERLIENLLEV